MYMDNITEPCKKRNKEWPFTKHCFKTDFVIDSSNKIIYKYRNFFNNKLDYIITLNNQLCLGIGHLYTSNDAEMVMCAGRIVINNYGYITYIDNKSGHYRPKLENIIYTLELFKSLNIDITHISGVIFNNQMQIIDYINKEPIPFVTDYKTNIAMQQDFLLVDIPHNFDWQVYREKNNLYHLNNEQQCQKHFQDVGYILGYKIAKNLNYHETT